jgi:hypothetical protein
MYYDSMVGIFRADLRVIYLGDAFPNILLLLYLTSQLDVSGSIISIISNVLSVVLPTTAQNFMHIQIITVKL